MIRRIHLLLLRLYRLLPPWGRRWVVRGLAPTYTVGTICIIERSDGALLFVRHSYRSRWGTPGGLLKRGEEPADAARREVLEEVNLAVQFDGEPAVVVEAAKQRIDIVYRVRLANGVDSSAARPISPEIQEVGWFAPDALPELQLETTTALIALARVATDGRAPNDGPRR